MDWKDFFRFRVYRETLQGSQLYFEGNLQVNEEFTLDELMLREFESLHLSDAEKKLFNLNARKIYLRHKYFNSIEFNRLVSNFQDRLSQEKDQFLTFSTHGGGVYLFLSLGKFLPEKKVVCYTSELPLDIFRENESSVDNIFLILKSTPKSFFKNFPTLWRNSRHIDLFPASKHNESK